MNIPEDDLPELEALREMSGDAIRWTVTTVGSEPIPGYIDDIGYIIDPNQHTAVVKGYIDNKGEKLRGGQFVRPQSNFRRRPTPSSCPRALVVDDGQQSIVFVETDAAKHYFTMRRVELDAAIRKDGLRPQQSL